MEVSCSTTYQSFLLVVLKNIVPTGENLTNRALYGPSWCILCKAASESTVHLFLQCIAIRPLWKNLSSSIGFAGSWNGGDLQNAWEDWRSRHSGSKILNLPLVVNWHIWKAHNRNIFDNKVVCWPRTEASIISSYLELPEPIPSRVRCINPPPIIDKSIPWAFFDEPQMKMVVGGGALYSTSVNTIDTK